MSETIVALLGLTLAFYLVIGVVLSIMCFTLLALSYLKKDTSNENFLVGAVILMCAAPFLWLPLLVAYSIGIALDSSEEVDDV